jgi:CBS domain-containing protein
MPTSMQPYQGSYLTPSFEHATVADVMTPGVLSCPPDAPIATVARTMATHHIHAVVVDGVREDPVRGERLVWGVVSDLDLARAALGGEETSTAGDVAVTEPIAVEPSAPLRVAARLMDEHRTTHLVVVDRERPVGMISSLDVAGACAWGRG